MLLLCEIAHLSFKAARAVIDVGRSRDHFQRRRWHLVLCSAAIEIVFAADPDTAVALPPAQRGFVGDYSVPARRDPALRSRGERNWPDGSRRGLGRLPALGPKPNKGEDQNAGSQSENVRPSDASAVPGRPGQKGHNCQNDYHDCRKRSFRDHGRCSVRRSYHLRLRSKHSSEIASRSSCCVTALVGLKIIEIGADRQPPRAGRYDD